MKAFQCGAAIVLAMGSVALAAVSATAVLSLQSTWARQVELVASHTQAMLLLDAGLDWSRAILAEDRRRSSVDYLGEVWSMQLPPIPIDNGRLSAHIDDEQGKFNINNLVNGGIADAAQLATYQRLLVLLELPDSLAESLVDWLDTDAVASVAGGAEDESYLLLNPPYLAANMPMVNISELLLVRGYDEKTRKRLAPFVTALPEATAVNLNTATPEVLSASIPKLSITDARTLVSQRGRSYFRDAKDFAVHLPAGIGFVETDFAVSSSYYLAAMEVSYGEASAYGHALLRRRGITLPVVVWQSKS